MLTIKKSLLNKMLFIVIVLFSAIAFIFLISNPPSKTSSGYSEIESDGKQLIRMTAKAGFSPSMVIAQAEKPTTLRISTKNTFDCSSTVSIPALGVNRSLPFTGETDIEIPPQVIGTTLTGTCSMGMYSFKISFT
ncbi:MAG: cupredoxin domain-containing protein [Candidatus Dojkabacteria bacterium]